MGNSGVGTEDKRPGKIKDKLGTAYMVLTRMLVSHSQTNEVSVGNQGQHHYPAAKNLDGSRQETLWRLK